MNSNKNNLPMGLLYIALGVISLLWFAYEVFGGRSAGDNPFLWFLMTGLKLFLAIWFFGFAFFKYLRTKN